MCLESFPFSSFRDNPPIDAARPGSTVDICASARDHRITVDTENTGSPIPEAEQTLIFEPFFTTKPKGTGLGLSIARNIARAHGGDLVLTTNGTDRVRFSFSLPYVNNRPQVET